jgi:hypothetical protein
LIDEYDSSLNRIFSEAQRELREHLKQPSKTKQEHEKFVSDTMEQSMFKRFFAMIKGKMDSGAIGRVYITGVSPMSLNDFTSNFNCAIHIAHHPWFSLMCGFTEKDIEKGLSQIAIPEEVSNLLKVMEDNYEGYKFYWEEKEKLFNPILSIYFMKYLSEYRRVPEGKKLIDVNVQPSESVLNMIALTPLSSQVIQDLLANYSKDRGYPLGTTIDDILDMKELMSLSTSKEQFLFSLMYYLGIVTHGNSQKTDTVCRIPKRIIKNEFVDKLFEIHSIDRHETAFEAVHAFLAYHDVQPLCTFLHNHNFLLLQSGDVDHSREMDLKQSFISTIVSVSDVEVVNELELKTITYESGKSYVSSADLVIPSCGIHVEFKNLMLEELVFLGKEPSTYEKKKNSWEEGKRFSIVIDKATNQDIVSIQLRESSSLYKKFAKDSSGNYLTRDLKTVQDAWDNLLEQTRQNKVLVEEKLKEKVVSFGVLRIGLHRLYCQKME